MFKLPHIPTAQELIDISYRAGAKNAKMVRGKGRLVPGKHLSSEIKRVEIIAGIVCGDLDTIIKYFPNYEELPVFHQKLLDLRVNKDKYKKALGTVDWASSRVKFLMNKTLRKIKTQKTVEHTNAYMGRVSSFIKRIDPELKFLIEVKKILLSFPILEETPTLVVAGLPNVGKSTFTKTLTGSNVKIASYPFTTVEILVGKIKVRHTTYQIIDSPGILDRPMSERNTVELQAVLAIECLADAILFLIDLTQDLNAQEKLLEEIRNNFKIPILVAINDKTGDAKGDYRIFNATEKKECVELFRDCFEMPKL